MASNKPPSKVKISRCGYCNDEMLDQNLAKHCRDQHNSSKFAKGDTHITSYFGEISESQKRKHSTSSVESQNAENLSSEFDSINEPYVSELESSAQFSKTTTHAVSEHHSALSSCDEKLDEILTLVKDIQITVKNPQAEKSVLPPIAKPSDIVLTDERMIHIQTARSLNKIIDNFTELRLNEQSDSQYVVCTLCCSDNTFEAAQSNGSLNQTNGVISIPTAAQLDFLESENLTKTFANLKKTIKQHLLNKTHKANLNAWKEREEEMIRIESRNRQVGMRVARVCYFLYKTGGSERDYEIEVLRKINDGIDMGDLNHSHNFPPKFRPFVAREVQARMKTFLTSRLPQTGCLPPVNVGADKGTNRHRTRQFLTALTVVPDADELLQPIYIGQPVVKDHTGPGVALSIKDGLDRYGIMPIQFEASSHDGQYFHLSVPENLRKFYDLDDRFVSTVDPLHRAGTVDNHIRKDLTFQWMVKVFTACKELYNKFNWGKNYELLVDTCKELERNMAQLVTFQTTRFANSIRLVVINVRADYEAIIQCLQKIQDYFRHSSDSKDKEKRNDAKRLLNVTQNKRFSLHLSGLADIYDMFGLFVNIVQKVNVLPHERYDDSMKVLDKMARMKNLQAHDQCNANQCLWPRYHADVKEILEDGTYQKVKIERNTSESMYQTRFAVSQNSANVQMDPISQTRDNLQILLTRLEKDLRAEAFERSTIELIERIRFVTDLQSLAKDVLSKGSIILGAQNSKLFVEHVRIITTSLDDISDQELKDSYKHFLSTLEVYAKSKDLKKVTSIAIIQDFVKSDLKLFVGCELAMQGILCASVKVSVESVVESLVSRYESHFTKSRNLEEENAMDEMVIAENGPSIFRANAVLSAAMNQYWKTTSKSGRWHFIRESSGSILDYGSTYGKTTMRLFQKQSKFPIMEL